MSQHTTIHIRAHNEHSVLQRVLLVFSRRRLRIEALQMFDLHGERAAQIQVDLACDPATGRCVAAQLSRIVEVVQVWIEHIPAQKTQQRNAALRIA